MLMAQLSSESCTEICLSYQKSGGRCASIRRRVNIKLRIVVCWTDVQWCARFEGREMSGGEHA